MKTGAAIVCRCGVVLACIASLAEPILACAPPVPIPRAQADANARRGFAAAADLVEVEIITATDYRAERPGTARVIRSFKGATKLGTVMPVRATAGSACGIDAAPAHSRHLIYLDEARPRSVPVTLYPLSMRQRADLVRLKLIPER